MMNPTNAIQTPEQFIPPVDDAEKSNLAHNLLPKQLELPF
jgi:hypothetical protein